jgi:hypothetical protein
VGFGSADFGSAGTIGSMLRGLIALACFECRDVCAIFFGFSATTFVFGAILCGGLGSGSARRLSALASPRRSVKLHPARATLADRPSNTSASRAWLRMFYALFQQKPRRFLTAGVSQNTTLDTLKHIRSF